MGPFPVDSWLVFQVMVILITAFLAFVTNTGGKRGRNPFCIPIRSRKPLHDGVFVFYELEGQASKLRRQGKEEKAKKKYLEAFNHVRDNMPSYGARILLRAGEWGPPSEAIGNFQRVADVSISRREFQMAVIALEGSLERCVRSASGDEAREIEGRIEAVKRDMPHNLEECFAELRRVLTPEQIEEFKSKKHLGELIGTYHMFLGKWMRNSWGLWHNSQLAEYFQEMGVREPDDMSTRILVGFYGHLNEESDDTR